MSELGQKANGTIELLEQLATRYEARGERETDHFERGHMRGAARAYRSAALWLREDLEVKSHG